MSMTANDWWTPFYNWAMVVYTFVACPVCFLFSILVIHMCALVLLDGGVLEFCVQDLVLCAGDGVVIMGGS